MPARVPVFAVLEAAGNCAAAGRPRTRSPPDLAERNRATGGGLGAFLDGVAANGFIPVLAGAILCALGRPNIAGGLPPTVYIGRFAAG